MIGIVVVSHSRALATAAVALAQEMTPEPPPIAVAAGLDQTTFGTDATAISEAITEVDSAEGVLVLLDLGSATLSAEMALEFLEPDIAARVRLSPAPLVEGLIAAVVTAATGAGLDEVAAEAAAGLEAKAAHLGAEVHPCTTNATGSLPSGSLPAGSLPAGSLPAGSLPSGSDHSPDLESAAPEAADSKSPGDAPTRVGLEWHTTITNEHGLHARPAAAFVSALRALDAEVQVHNETTGAGPAPGTSLSKLAMLGLRQGHQLRATISGRDAHAARDALQSLAQTQFGETRAAWPAAVSTAPTATASSDPPTTGGSGHQVVMAPAHLADVEVDITGYQPSSEEAGLLRRTRDHLANRLRASGDEILQMQSLLLTDPELDEELVAALDSGYNAAQAVEEVFTRASARFATLVDPYQAERAEDLRSLRRLLLAALLETHSDQTPSEPHVLVVPELDAATAAGLDPLRCLAVITTTGGSTGHGVIIATGRGIPVLAGRAEAAAIRTGQLVALDPLSHELWVDPDAATQTMVTQRVLVRDRDEAAARELADRPALTGAGHRVLVEANVGSIQDAYRGASSGAEGSGLVRTELLFGHLGTAPTAREQADVLIEIGHALPAHAITIRTWDVGGDKPLPFLPQVQELNPFLGERGLRTMRRVPELFAEQLRAVALASRRIEVRLMFPMVTEPAEMVWARDLARAAIAEMEAEPFPIGMMVEVPAAALRAAEFAPLVDFVSIGTNDLTQYTTAADRTNGVVAHLARADSAGVLSLMRMTCEQLPGVPVAVCGDLASQPAMVATLVAMGVSELSVRPPLVPQIKQSVRGC